MDDMIDRVKQGVEFLDKNEPGWLDLVKLDELDLSHPHTCVLGQVHRKKYGRNGHRWGYFQMLEKYGEDYHWAVAHGFAAQDGNEEDDFAGEEEGYERLTETWEDTIQELREEREQ